MKLALLSVLALLAGGSAPHLVARIPTGSSPGGAVSAFGAVWVANDGAGTLTRVDPASNRVTKRIRLRPGVFSVARGFGALWVVNYKTSRLARVDPGSGRVRSVRVGAVPFDVLAAYGRIWVTAWEAGRLVSVDPSTLGVRSTPIGARPTGIRAAAGALWVGFGRSATAIARVDPRTRRIERVQVGVRAPSWFVAGTRDLWVQAADHVLVRVDPATRKVKTTLSFGSTLARGSSAPDGTMWIPDKEQNVVYRVDSRAGVLGSFEAGRGAFFALAARGSMWVTSYAGDDIWRFSP